MGEGETRDGDEPSDNMIELEALITAPDPLWWSYDLEQWDLLYSAIPF
jgi:hypothetical protein